MVFQHFVLLVLTKNVQHSHDGDKGKKGALQSEICFLIVSEKDHQSINCCLLKRLLCKIISIISQADSLLHVGSGNEIAILATINDHIQNTNFLR